MLLRINELSFSLNKLFYFVFSIEFFGFFLINISKKKNYILFTRINILKKRNNNLQKRNSISCIIAKFVFDFSCQFTGSLDYMVYNANCHIAQNKIMIYNTKKNV